MNGIVRQVRDKEIAAGSFFSRTAISTDDYTTAERSFEKSGREFRISNEYGLNLQSSTSAWLTQTFQNAPRSHGFQNLFQGPIEKPFYPMRSERRTGKL